MKDQPLLDEASGERLVTVMTPEHEEFKQTENEYDEKHRNSSGKFLEALGITRLTKCFGLFQFGGV